MGIPVAVGCKLGPTVGALVRLGPRVDVDMVLEVLAGGESPGAHGALKRLELFLGVVRYLM